MQYASAEYVDRLKAHKILISMSRLAYPYDNAMAESFMKTLKTEEVEGRPYRDIAHARDNRSVDQLERALTGKAFIDSPGDGDFDARHKTPRNLHREPSRRLESQADGSRTSK